MQSRPNQAAARFGWDTRRSEFARTTQALAMEGPFPWRASDSDVAARFDSEFHRSASARFPATFPSERKPQPPCSRENNAPREISECRMAESDGELQANHRS